MPGSVKGQLVVEGKDDQHVIWALCAQHRLPQVFEVEQVEGVDALLAGIPVRLKASGLPALGIVVDADADLPARWQAVRSQLVQAGYADVPPQPDADGLVLVPLDLPRVGVWLMPDNTLPGALEDFVAYLIPEHDQLAPFAESSLDEIEAAGAQRYRLTQRSKAFVHTWLAWQEIPGQPMGQAITARALQHDRPLALRFVNWLRRVFFP